MAVSAKTATACLRAVGACHRSGLAAAQRGPARGRPPYPAAARYGVGAEGRPTGKTALLSPLGTTGAPFYPPHPQLLRLQKLAGHLATTRVARKNVPSKGVISLASVKKFTAGAVYNQLRHDLRQIEHPSNEDIDPDRCDLNYVLSPQREISDYDYFLQRKEELYVYGRSDVKVMASWIVTAPDDLAVVDEKRFFQSVYDFLEERYGAENTVQATVHRDEGGKPHLHYCFIPVVEDIKHGGEKICANEVLDRKELRSFHPALQRHLEGDGIDCHVQTGITEKIGHNLTVDELKELSEYVYERNRTREREQGASW